MKRKLLPIICITATLSGCGQIDKASSSANNEIQTYKPIAAQTENVPESVTEEKATAETTASPTKAATTTTTEAVVTATEMIIIPAHRASAPAAKQETSAAGKPQYTAGISTACTTETPAEILTTEAATVVQVNPDEITDLSGIFEKLNALSYQPMTCDGLPEKTFVDENGTRFSVNFSARWVWRNGIEEAYLTDELYNLLISSEPITMQ